MSASGHQDGVRYQESAGSGLGRLHSLTNSRFREAKLQGPLLGDESKKRFVVSRPDGDDFLTE